MNPDLLAQLQEEGLTRGESGVLTRELPLGSLVIPQHVELVGSGEEALLTWATTGRSSGPVHKRDFSGVLDDFIRLGDAAPERILRFAKKYGVLELCEHLYPLSHAEDKRVGLPD